MLKIFTGKSRIILLFLAVAVTGAFWGLKYWELILVEFIFVLFFLNLIFPLEFLVVTFSLLPFLPALNIGEGFDLASIRILIPGLFLIWLIRSLVNKKTELPHGPIIFFTLLFIFFCSISLWYTPVLERSLRKLLVFLSIFPLIFVVYGLLKEQGEKGLKKISGGINGGTLLVIFLGFLQFLAQFYLGSKGLIKIYQETIAPFFWGKTTAETVTQNPSWLVNVGDFDLMRSFSILPDPHMLSYFLSFGIPFLFAGGVLSSGGKRIFFFFTAFLGLVLEMLTFSRGGYLGLFLGAGFFFLIIFLAKKIKIETVLIILFGGVLILLLSLFLPNNPINHRIVSIFNFEEGSNQGRIKIWQEALTVFKEHPLVGSGLGSYSYAISPSLSYRAPVYAHSLYLEFVSELGVIGLMLFLGIIGFTFRSLVKYFFKNKTSALGTLALASAVSLLWFLTHSFFEMPIYSPVILPLFVFLLAFGCYLEEKN